MHDFSGLAQIEDNILSQVSSLFDFFTQSLGAQFASIEARVSEVASSWDMPAVSMAHVNKPVSFREISAEDVTNVLSFHIPRW